MDAESAIAAATATSPPPDNGIHANMPLGNPGIKNPAAKKWSEQVGVQ